MNENDQSTVKLTHLIRWSAMETIAFMVRHHQPIGKSL